MALERRTIKTYRIQNRITNEWWEGQAASAQEACEQAGWQICNCWVREFPLARWPRRPEVR